MDKSSMIMIIIMHLMMQAQCQPDVYTKRKQYYPASNIYARIFIFYYMHKISPMLEQSSMDQHK